MSFRAAPVPITNLASTDVLTSWHVVRVFEVTKADLLNCRALVGLLPLDQNIIRLNVCELLVVVVEDINNQRRYDSPVCKPS